MTIKTFIDRPLLSAVVVLLCWISIPVLGQNNLSSISVDPEADSIASKGPSINSVHPFVLTAGQKYLRL